MNKLTRRELLGLTAVAGGAALLGLAGCTAKRPAPTKPEPLQKLTMMGPQSPATVLLAHLAGQEGLKKSVAGEVAFSTVKTPDQLRAAIAAKEVLAAAVPTNVAANLFNKGVSLSLINVTVWGTLYVSTTNPDIKGWADLKGKNVVVPTKGDIPDIVFKYLAGKAGLTVEPTYVASMPEAMQLLVAGKADAAVLAEPVASAAEIQGKAKGVRRALDLQQEWGRLTGQKSRFPMVATVAIGPLLEHPAVIAAMQDGMKAAAEWMKQNPKEAAALGEQHLTDLKAPVIEHSLGFTPLEVVPAAEARSELEFFFARLKELSPDLIGGDLPAKSFYYGAQ